MGKDNCVFITNPSDLNSDSIKLARFTAEQLGVKLYENPVQEIYDKIKDIDQSSFESSNLKQQPAGLSSMQAVLRTVQGLAASHRFGSGIVCTGNHTEVVLGWCSFHDIGSIGIHMPLGDLTKTELYKFSEFINEYYTNKYKTSPIPAGLYDGNVMPAAELPDSKEDPIDYKIQSGICAELIRKRKSIQDLLDEFKSDKLSSDSFDDLDYVYSKVGLTSFKEQIIFAIKAKSRSVYKAEQSAPIVVLSPRSRGFSNRETLINKYDYGIGPQ
jgi:NH3-dependent NAD+ synthetase